MRFLCLCVFTYSLFASSSWAAAQSPAYTPLADLPAVAEANGKLSAEGGIGGARGIPTRGQGVLSGSFTLPLLQSFGFQMDGAAATLNNLFVGGTGVHLFWRDPKTALVGATGGVFSVGGATFGRFGGETDLYVNDFATLSAGIGYQTGATSAKAIIPKGAYGKLGATFYPEPNLAISLSASRNPGVWGGNAEIEYQPAGWKSVSLFANTSIAEHREFSAKAGARIYFGSSKTLIRRHREDDPTSYMAALADLAAHASWQQYYNLVNNPPVLNYGCLPPKRLLPVGCF